MRRSTVLIVDDRETNRYIRTQVLTHAGYETIEADDAATAWEKCISEKPDLALLDVHLPDRDGISLSRDIKANPDTSGIMVIQISASAIEIRDAIQGLEAGADDYLIEPVDPKLLVAKVQSLLRLQRIEKDLRRSNEDLSRFAYAASHDLQEPLRNVSISAQRLQLEYGSHLEPKAKGYISEIVGGANRMSNLIKDLLEYSQISTVPVENASTDLEQLFAELTEVIAPRLQEVGGTIERDRLPVIQATPSQIKQLFINLLDNAIKYRRSDRPVAIQVRAERLDRFWQFSVSDNGQGFEQQWADQIFGLFRRLHGGTIGGSGIGLSICKVIVERGGGKIWAESTPGHGATFFLTWPIS